MLNQLQNVVVVDIGVDLHIAHHSIVLSKRSWSCWCVCAPCSVPPSCRTPAQGLVLRPVQYSSAWPGFNRHLRYTRRGAPSRADSVPSAFIWEKNSSTREYSSRSVSCTAQARKAHSMSHLAGCRTSMSQCDNRSWRYCKFEGTCSCSRLRSERVR